MNNKAIRQILVFSLLLALQILVFNHIHLFGFLNPNVYLLALLLLPLELPKSAQYAIAFVTGFIVDIFQMSILGVNTSASMIVILLRPYVMNLLNVNKKKHEMDVPMPGKKDFKWLALYTLILTFTHQFFITMLEVFSFQRFGLVLLSIVSNTLCTSLIILCSEYLFIPTKKNS